jgi:hypothetical protein
MEHAAAAQVREHYSEGPKRIAGNCATCSGVVATRQITPCSRLWKRRASSGGSTSKAGCPAAGRECKVTQQDGASTKLMSMYLANALARMRITHTHCTGGAFAPCCFVCVCFTGGPGNRVPPVVLVRLCRGLRLAVGQTATLTVRQLLYLFWYVDGVPPKCKSQPSH